MIMIIAYKQLVPPIQLIKVRGLPAARLRKELIMPIGKHIYESLLKEKHPTIKYIFVTDDIFLADNLLGEDDFTVVYITRGNDGDYFTKEEFTEYLCGKGFAYARDYFYLPVFMNAAAWRYMTGCFKAYYITYSENVYRFDLKS